MPPEFFTLLALIGLVVFISVRIWRAGDDTEERGPTASLHPPKPRIWGSGPSIATILLWFFLFPPVGGTLMAISCRRIADWEYWAGFVVPFYGMIKFAVCD